MQNLRFRRRVQLVFALSALVSAAWLSVEFDAHFDWTHGARATLSTPSRALLETLAAPVDVKVFAAPNRRPRETAAKLLARYARFKHDLTVTYVNPAEVPAELRELEIGDEGDMVIEYRGRTQLVTEHTETALSSALAYLARSEERWLAFVTGHGERSFLGKANHDLGVFGTHLNAIGIKPQPLNLTAVDQVPANTSLIVISTPEVALLEPEVERLKRYLRDGGNLLWLAEPASTISEDWLAAELGLALIPGTVVDPNAPLMGVNQPTIVVLTAYEPHPTTEGFDLVTVLPEVTGLEILKSSTWTATPIGYSSAQAWSDTDLSTGVASFDDGDRGGPLLVALALEREHPSPSATGRQRVIVVGDGDFLSNTYVGNAGNLELGTAFVNWLSHDEALLKVPVRNAPDQRLVLSRADALLIGFGSLFALPGGLALTGMVVWWKRRRR